MLDMQDIRAIECMSIKEDWKYETQSFDYKLDLKKLRHSISSSSSNSWVKTKKKLYQGDNSIAYKSLFHSLRILDFGIQIAKYNKIKNFETSQSDTLNKIQFLELLDDIKKLKTWGKINNHYKKIYNTLRSEFKILAPK